MLRLLSIFAASQFMTFAVSSQYSDLERQYKQIEGLLNVTENHELLRVFSMREDEIKQLLNNPEQINVELEKAIDNLISESLREITENPQ